MSNDKEFLDYDSSRETSGANDWWYIHDTKLNSAAIRLDLPKLHPPSLHLAFFLFLTTPTLPLSHKNKDTTKMEQATVESHQRSLIIDHAQALYGAQYPINHTWAVLTTHLPRGILQPKYISHVIVYDQPGSLQTWRVLVSTKDLHYNEYSALRKLLDELKITLVKKMMEDGKLKTSED
jgi:hypothetical protein